MASVLTVSQLNKYVSFKIKSDLKLKGIAVKGEISNFTVHYKSGHAYFTVKDENSAVKAVMFSSNVSKLKFLPENGMNVLVLGSLEVYERDGVYQIIASDITPLGTGAVHTQVEQIKEKLRKQGIFDESTKKPIPLVPKKLAVVTSLTGAALQDILHIVQRRYPVCSVEIYPAQVQGISAVKSICSSLANADKSGADTVILARGGGSLEDLMPFNTEEVALAVAGCKTPVISAVGHETDTTLSDYAADMRAPTPSAAAELSTPDKNDMINAIQLLKKKLDKAVQSRLDVQFSAVEALRNRIKALSPMHKLENDIKRVELINSRLESALNRKIERSEAELEKLAAQLNALSPFNVLKRGYSLTEKDGMVVDNSNVLQKGDIVTIRFSESSAKAEIVSVEENS